MLVPPLLRMTLPRPASQHTQACVRRCIRGHDVVFATVWNCRGVGRQAVGSSDLDASNAGMMRQDCRSSTQVHSARLLLYQRVFSSTLTVGVVPSTRSTVMLPTISKSGLLHVGKPTHACR